MSLLQRFLLGPRENPGEETGPGVVLHDDGTVWVVDAAGVETQIPAANGGSLPFNGCRYAMEDGGSFVQLVNSTWLAAHMTTNAPYYDTDNYASSGFDESFITNDGYLHAPVSGWYRITVGVVVDFTIAPSDATGVLCVIASPERDSEWDTEDHLTVVRGGLDVVAASRTITHWLAASDRVHMSADRLDGSSNPHAKGSIQMELVTADSVNPYPF